MALQLNISSGVFVLGTLEFQGEKKNLSGFSLCKLRRPVVNIVVWFEVIQ